MKRLLVVALAAVLLLLTFAPSAGAAPRFGVKGSTVWVRGDAKRSIVTCTWISYDYGTALSPIPYKWRVRLAPHQYATNSRSDATPRHVRCVYHRW